MYEIISSVNRDNFPFPFSFLIRMPFISSSYQFALAGTPGTILNTSGESGHFCLVPDFRRKTFSLSALSIMFAVGFSYMAFIHVQVVSFYS